MIRLFSKALQIKKKANPYINQPQTRGILPPAEIPSDRQGARGPDATPERGRGGNEGQGVERAPRIGFGPCARSADRAFFQGERKCMHVQGDLFTRRVPVRYGGVSIASSWLGGGHGWADGGASVAGFFAFLSPSSLGRDQLERGGGEGKKGIKRRVFRLHLDHQVPCFLL